MTLPPSLRGRLTARFGAIRDVEAVSGGCIHHAARIGLADGPAFLKWGAAPPGHFAAEACGLERLRAAVSPLRIPRVLGWADGEETTPAWLCVEWLNPAGEHADDAPVGRGLAVLHRTRGEGWGSGEDGWIGPLPQANGATSSWAEFWWARRIEPQLLRAREQAREPARHDEWLQLRDRLPELVAAGEAEGPSLLHGDLWAGNVLRLAGSEAALVDPAVYHGHREVDLAMADLFGGFGPAFRSAYEAEWPLLPGYQEVRRPIYQLYPLLVHCNLFGGGYGARIAATLRTVLAA